MALVVGELLIIVFGDDPLAVPPPPGLDGSVSVLGAVYPTYRLLIIVVGAVLALLVYLVVDRTRVGALVRATVADREMVAAIGVDNRLVKAAVFAIGSLLATTAGVLGGPVYGARPGLDATVLILALVVVVIGGLGSVRGALVGALDHRAGGHPGPGAAARPGLVHPVRARWPWCWCCGRAGCSADRSRRARR